MSSKFKFLILNPDPNNLETILVKSNLQNSKNGPFESTFLLGDVISNVSNSPQETIALSTYISKGKKDVTIPDNKSEEKYIVVKSNLTYVNSLVTILKLASGLRVAILSADAEIESKSEEVLAGIDQAPKIDILLTYSWPYTIAREQKLSLVGNKFIDTVVKKVMPRYHFAVGNERGKFFEFQPFKWSNDTTTRFISLAQEGSGERWFYAFSIGLDNDGSDTKLTENPFTKVVETPKRKLEETNPESREEKLAVKKKKVISPDQCFFCLSNPKVETHMIVSIGKHSYLTVAKGPLTRPSKGLVFSGHAIIIPIDHIPTIRQSASEVTESPIYKEIELYKKTICEAFLEQAPDLRLVFFEVNRLDNVHHHVQLLPIPKDAVATQFPNSLSEKTKLNNETFSKNAELDFKKFESDDDAELQKIINNSDYILFSVFEDLNKKTTYIAEIGSDKPVDLQFPRRVLAHTLKCPKRTYWEKCQQPKFKETRDCEEFKKFYDKYDFTSK